MKFLRRNREIAEEIEAHLRMAREDGISRREFGNELLVREVTRDVWGWTAVERVGRDLGYALRQIRRAPGFAAAAILTLALGLGATAAMFSIVNGVLLEPLQFRDPGRLYLARYVAPPAANLKGDFPVNARHFHEWRTRCQSCEQVSLMHPIDITLTGAGEPEKLLGLEVSFNFFRTLGVQPALGRDFLPEEDHAGANGDRVILSNSFWRDAFASSPGVIGRSIQLNGEAYTVIGVMPPDLHLPRGEQWGTYSGPAVDAQIFRPLLVDPSSAIPYGSFNYTSVIRLKGGAEAHRVQDELAALVSQFQRSGAVLRLVLIPLRDKMTAGARQALWLLLSAVVAVLLIVCVNIGNLMLVRTASRCREAGVRMTLGASRAELFRLVLGEALLLVAIGGALGLFVAWGGLKLFAAAAPVDLPRIDEVGIDWRVIGFAGVASLLSTILCGVFPAWRLAGTDPVRGVRGQGTGDRIRAREWLVTAEVALSTLLLVIGGLLTMSFLRVMRADKGFETAHVITQDVSFLHPKYAAGGRNRFVPLVVEKLREIPGVRAVGVTSTLPLRGEDWTDLLVDPTQPAAPSRAALGPIANFRFVTPDYWTAMGTALKRGRFLRESEKDARVAVVSENAARLLWPGSDPIGRRVRGTGGNKSPLEVVGVVADVRANVEQDPQMMVYEPYNLVSPIGVSIVVRTVGDPAAVIRSMRAALREADPDMALASVKTMDQIVDESVAARRFETALAAAFALAALALASLGVYGVVSFAVARRTPEIGIRMALGARTAQVAGMVLRQGIRPVLAGLAAGIGCGLPAGRFIASQLYGVAPDDPLTITAVALVLLVAGAGACLIPARRAMRIDPMRALRFE
jgi:putative ABC transport system permease protein